MTPHWNQHSTCPTGTTGAERLGTDSELSGVIGTMQCSAAAVTSDAGVIGAEDISDAGQVVGNGQCNECTGTQRQTGLEARGTRLRKETMNAARFTVRLVHDTTQWSSQLRI